MQQRPPCLLTGAFRPPPPSPFGGRPLGPTPRSHTHTHTPCAHARCRPVLNPLKGGMGGSLIRVTLPESHAAAQQSRRRFAPRCSPGAEAEGVLRPHFGSEPTGVGITPSRPDVRCAASSGGAPPRAHRRSPITIHLQRLRLLHENCGAVPDGHRRLHVTWGRSWSSRRQPHEALRIHPPPDISASLGQALPPTHSHLRSQARPAGGAPGGTTRAHSQNRLRASLDTRLCQRWKRKVALGRRPSDPTSLW